METDKAHILVVDDDTRLRSLLQRFLRENDFYVSVAKDAAEARERLSEYKFDLLIVDIMMPNESGLDFLGTLRQESMVPVILLTAMGETADRIAGLETGADDYLAKPFEPRELVARIHNILRRSQPQTTAKPDEPETLSFRQLSIDQQRRKVRLSNDDLELTNSEYELLLMFAREPDKAFSRDDILNNLRGINADLYTRSVDILVSRLRQKLKPLNCIQTVWGSGYRFLTAEA